MTADELIQAIYRGDGDAIAAALVEDPGLASARDGDGVSATMHALYRGRGEIAETIAAALPALDVFEAAAMGRAVLLGQIVARDPSLARGLSPDGFTALHYPAFFGRGDAVGASRALLAAGADPN